MTGENVASLVPDWPEIAPPPRLGLGSRFHCLQKETRAPIRAINKCSVDTLEDTILLLHHSDRH